MIPLYDTVRFQKFPFITLTLIAVNVLAFLYETRLDTATLQRFIFTWGLIPGRFVGDPLSGWLYIFTSMFLHGGWLHILSNMWILYFLLLWLGLQVYSGIFAVQGSGIAWWAHIGGFMFGAFMVSFFVIKRREYRDLQ